MAIKRTAAVRLKGPPLLRALIWSIVVSFWREDVLEKARRVAIVGWDWRRHVCDGALRALEANVRAAMRGVVELLRAVARRAVDLLGAAIVCGEMGWIEMVVLLELFGASIEHQMHGPIE